jgi:hypothetical protein
MNDSLLDTLEDFFAYGLHECSACRLQFWEPRKLPDARLYSAMYGERNARILPREPGYRFPGGHAGCASPSRPPSQLEHHLVSSHNLDRTCCLLAEVRLLPCSSRHNKSSTHVPYASPLVVKATSCTGTSFRLG